MSLGLRLQALNVGTSGRPQKDDSDATGEDGWNVTPGSMNIDANHYAPDDPESGDDAEYERVTLGTWRSYASSPHWFSCHGFTLSEAQPFCEGAGGIVVCLIRESLRCVGCATGASDGCCSLSKLTS